MVQGQHFKQRDHSKTRGRVYNVLNEVRYKKQLHIKIVVLTLKKKITYFLKNISTSQKLKDKNIYKNSGPGPLINLQKL